MKKLIISGGLVLAAAMAFAAVDDWGFNYQAELRNADGSVITGADKQPVRQQKVELRLYNASSGGAALWGHSYDVYCDDNGLFNVFLSDATGNNLSGTAGKSLQAVFRENAPSALYIGLKVTGDKNSEIQPRQRICAVPYAAVAKDIASGATALGDLTVKGDVAMKSSLVVSESLTAKSITLTDSGALVPVGGIIMWSKDEAPDGKVWNGSFSQDGMWAKCDGTKYDGVNATPDMRDRFPVGAGLNYAYDAAAGSAEVQLTESQIPSHRHTYWTPKYVVEAYTASSWNKTSMQDTYSDLKNAVTETLQVIAYEGAYQDSTLGSPAWSSGNYGWLAHVKAGASGSSGKHENRPPYRAVYFIMRIK